MIHHTRTLKRTAAKIALLLSLVLTTSVLYAQDGKALFSQNCASCHAINKDLTGPALKGVEDRWPNKQLLYKWIRNNQEVIKSGDPYAVNLYNTWNKTQMNLFPSLTDAEIEAILKYIREYKDPVVTDADKGGPDDKSSGNNGLLFGVLTLILTIVALILLQVNSNLKKLADDKEGVPAKDPVPFYKNKTYIALIAVVLFVVGGYYTIEGAIGLGRQKDYQPEQPVFFSHKVHAGINQINCMYCHGGVWESKHAGVPSLNVCMNCHTAISEYNGPKLYTAEGKEIDGTTEIQRLYEYAGFTKGKPWDPSKAKPVEWIKIHNLPDHVAFNHAQHIRAGKVQCQTCHGEIQKMDEVKQFADLSMGWCVNCHRTTKVQFTSNGFYSIYKKYHNDLKKEKIDSVTVGGTEKESIDSVTVEMIGGTDCQKCHY